MTAAHALPRPSTVAARPAGAATELLSDYTPGDETSFFTGPTRTLLTHGTHVPVRHGAAPLTQRVREALGRARALGQRSPLVVGAVPFDAAAPAALSVPATVRHAPGLPADPLALVPAPPPAATAWTMRPVPTRVTYRDAVREAVTRMAGSSPLDKVVLARTLELTAPHTLDLPAMLQQLARRDVAGYTFAVPTGPGRTLLGASPELLVARRDGHLTANPLAGSAPRSADLAEDVQRAAALLESAKDLHEHALVVDAVRAELEPFCRTLHVPPRPTLARTAAMWHLSTTLTAELAEPAAGALELAMALHPTPAVCGTPTGAARDTIHQLEPFQRGLYGGVVGWQDVYGDGEWVVTLRCAEAEGRQLRLYAGAGIVPDSTPEAEADETDAKFTTFLQALGAHL